MLRIISIYSYVYLEAIETMRFEFTYVKAKLMMFFFPFCITIQEGLSPANYIENVKQALDVLIANVPRAFVNVVSVLNITVVNQLNQNFICSTIHLWVDKKNNMFHTPVRWKHRTSLPV